MPTLLSFHDQQHITRMFVQEQRVNMIFNQFVSAIAPEMRKWKDAGNKNSVWVRNPGVEKAIDRYLIQLQSNLENEIKSGQTKAWEEAVIKNDKMVEGYIKGMALSTIVKDGMFKRNLDALELLQNRTENGLNLSQRVWNITGQTKGNIELFLESGIGSGRSADAISRDFRQLLNNPDKCFRRVRDKDGKLVPSQPMKDYHPGRGVYKSAKMNAIRVSATETNMGYRMSDCERWKQLDFVLGFEVKRSRNGHPCALCDSLVGKYPKEFIFPGWHPFCICIAVPIVLEHEDFADFLLTDQIPADKYVRDIPANAGKWMNDYVSKNPGKPPLFYKPNENLFDKIPETLDLDQIKRNVKYGKITEDIFMPGKDYTPERKQLHEEIINDYLNVEKVESDKVYMLGGAPANGKSSVVDSGMLPHPEGGLIIDPDKVKGMIPEYKTMLASGDKELIGAAANFVHEESSILGKEIQRRAFAQKYGTIIDGVNDGAFEKVVAKADEIRKLSGKPIRADYVSLDTDLSLKLADIRYQKTGRRVPPDYIAKMNKEVSVLVPELIKNNTFDELYLWDTNINGKPRLILKQVNGKLEIVDKDLYRRFLDKAK